MGIFFKLNTNDLFMTDAFTDHLQNIVAVRQKSKGQNQLFCPLRPLVR